MGKLTRLRELVEKRKAAEAQLSLYVIRAAHEIAHVIKCRREAEVKGTVYSVVGQGETWGITVRGHYDKWLPYTIDSSTPDSIIYQFALDFHEIIKRFEEQETGARFCAGAALNNICPQKEEV